VSYIDQIPKLKFKPITPKLFKTIQWDGLDEETGKYKPSQWKFTELKLSVTDKKGLINLSPDQIEKFNNFDIELKNKYKLKLIDLIDYSEGRVFIVGYIT
jgi:hypothetical protein